MKAKNGLKRMSMTKGEDITFPELQKRYLKKCLVNNLSLSTGIYNPQDLQKTLVISGVSA